MSTFDKIEPTLARLPASQRQYVQHQVERVVGAVHQRRGGLGERGAIELVAAVGAFLSAQEVNARGRETLRAVARGEPARRIEWRGAQLVVVEREGES